MDSRSATGRPRARGRGTAGRESGGPPPRTGDGKAAPGAQSIHRAVVLLREIASTGRAGVRLVDLVARTGLEHPTVHRMLKALAAEGMVQQHPENRRYALSHLVYELGLAATPRVDLRAICQAPLDRLAQASGDTVFLNIRSGFDTVCLDRREGWFPIKTLVYDVGSRRPLGVGAGGLALMLSLSPAEIEEIMTVNAGRITAYGNLTPESLLGALRRSQELGYGLSENQAVPGVSAVGVPVRGPSGAPLGAMSIAAISSRMSDARKAELCALLRAEAQEVERTVREMTRT